MKLVCRRAPIWLVAVFLFAALFSAVAADLGSIATNPELRTRFTYLGIAVFALFLLILSLLIYVKIRGARASRMEMGMTLSDVSSMQKKGLLTEEESKRVRQALSRQLSKQLEAKPAAGGGIGSLLNDPEVKRLQAIAQARTAQPSPDRDPLAIPNPAPQRVRPASAPAPGPETLRPIGAEDLAAFSRTSGQPAQPAFRPAAVDSSSPASSADDDVALPPDVMTMAQLGLISAEELANIKQRIRAKRNDLGQL